MSPLLNIAENNLAVVSFYLTVIHMCERMVLIAYAGHKDPDQPAHSLSLIRFYSCLHTTSTDTEKYQLWRNMKIMNLKVMVVVVERIILWKTA